MDNLFLCIGGLGLAISQTILLLECYKLSKRIEELEILKEAFFKVLKEEDINGKG